MTFQDSVRTCLGKYVDFTGRARRSEYWLCFLPNLAVGARRLHNTSRTGWWQLIGIISCVGWIVLIIFFVQDSHGDNQYGPSPKTGAQPVY